MQFSEHWLRMLVNPDLTSDELGHLLTMAGLEVEEQVAAAPPFEKVVVGRILTAEPHPNADKLRICRVDVGQAEPLQIVCGAPNASVGLLVPCALVGARLPGFEIKAAKLRGIESFGMLCSGQELGIPGDEMGLLVMPGDPVPGSDLREVLGLDDTLFTIKLTPNRADCLSLVGIAREVAALTGAPLRLPHIDAAEAATHHQRGVVLDAPAACPRYCGRVVAGVNARAETPGWMKQRLARSGIRSISALVDVTNYVMLELGQPLHAFDNARLEGAIHVRFPIPGEALELLNGQRITPDGDTLLIADEARPLALAGIMGGEQSGVTLESTEIFLESAFFAPAAVSGRARRYGFSSDASHRFERGVDFDLPRRALERATQLIRELCGGQAGPIVEAASVPDLPSRPWVLLRPERVRRLLGIDLDDVAILGLLQRIHLDVQPDGSDYRVQGPSYRFDIEIEEDLVEEVARLHGYDNMPAPEPRGLLAMLPQTETARSAWSVRHLLAERDYLEVVSYAFVEEAWERDFAGNAEPIRLANPIASQMSVMRSSLIGGLVATLLTNQKRQAERIRVFELGRCFLRDDSGEGVVPGFHQPLRLGLLAAGTALPEQWGSDGRLVDFYDLKGDLEALFLPAGLEFAPVAHPGLHPGRSATLHKDGCPVGVLGELHPLWVQRYGLSTAPIVAELELDAVLRASLPSYEAVSRLPAVKRDLAFILDAEMPAGMVLAGLKAVSPAIVRSVWLFDEYHGKGVEAGKKSLAFRVLLQDTQRTLEEHEVEGVVGLLIKHAAEAYGAKLRG
ncbi:MAG: phenylalanine--tRNA ligase subunit beta [Zoogloeaceae bacterium]|nr:phenylalanine--tRNA ligase subunit beta [Zoogloeaceae bacterium]